MQKFSENIFGNLFQAYFYARNNKVNSKFVLPLETKKVKSAFFDWLSEILYLCSAEGAEVQHLYCPSWLLCPDV